MSRVSNAFNVTIGSAPNTTLYNTAASLAVGSITSFGSGPSWKYADAVTWQTNTVGHDATRKRVHVMGKVHSITDYEHYIYDEQSQAWTNDLFGASGSGHVWVSAFAPEHGEYYLQLNGGGGGCYRYTPGSTPTNGSWSEIATTPGFVGTWSYLAGMGWHPNLYGAGDGGLVTIGGGKTYAWRRQTGQWSEIDSGKLHAGYNGGAGAYDALNNKLWVGTGNGVENAVPSASRAVIASQGPSLSHTQTFPAPVYGGGESESCHKVIPHPYVAGRLLFIPGNYGGTCYYSDNTGASWASAGYTNPFTNTGHQWTCGTVYGVVYGIASRNGGWVKLWKPPS